MTRHSARKPRPAFTPRQREILRLLLTGHTQKAAAVELGISERTVIEQLSRARARAGVASTAMLLARAGAHGLGPRSPLS